MNRFFLPPMSRLKYSSALLLSFFLAVLCIPKLALYSATEASLEAQPPATEKQRSVYVIPIQGQIGKSTFFILRRGLKEALVNGVDTIVLDINTPGGGLDVTVDIMKALDNFEGDTFAYINDEAISAGAYIAVATEQIYFAPKALIGAAAVIQGTGKDLDETLKMKVDSYMLGNIARFSGEHPYRAKVMRAMMDKDYELIIEGETLKKKGELLTLWTEQAVQQYGEQGIPLLGTGVVESVEQLLDTAYGSNNYSVKRFRITWSEKLAQIVAPFIPIVLGIGMLLLFIEFKTPGFGFFGIAGISLLVAAFLSNYIAGLAGYEPLLFFLLGVILLGLEIFLFPGLIIPGLIGICMILGSLLWSMADLWPSVSDGVQWNTDALILSMYNLLLALSISILGSIVLLRWFPKTRWHRQLILGHQPAAESPSPTDPQARPAIGARGVASTDIHPGGEIEIDGRRYEAHVRLGMIKRGAAVRVIDYQDFTVIVDCDTGSAEK